MSLGVVGVVGEFAQLLFRFLLGATALAVVLGVILAFVLVRKWVRRSRGHVP